MKRLLIDTQLLCLFVVGRVELRLISKHKRLDAYGPKDFELLTAVISRFPTVVVTPHILTETSNLLRHSHEQLRNAASASLAEVVGFSTEFTHPAIQLVERPEFKRLGLTDSALLMLASEDCVLLSDDLDLFLAAQAAGYPSINYNHLRDGAITVDEVHF